MSPLPSPWGPFSVCQGFYLIHSSGAQTWDCVASALEPPAHRSGDGVATHLPGMAAWPRPNPPQGWNERLPPDPWPLPWGPQPALLLPPSPSAGPGPRAFPVLTQVPDVGIVAHARRRPLKIQARIGHCQLLAAVGVPGQVCGRPLDLLGIPLGESKGQEAAV